MEKIREQQDRDKNMCNLGSQVNYWALAATLVVGPLMSQDVVR